MLLMMSKEELRTRLLRTWQLVSSVIRFEMESFETSWLMSLPVFLIYTAEGYVCTVLGAKNRPALAINDPGIATDAEFASEANGN